MATTDYSLAHTLPANIEAERSILGAILLDNFAFNEAAEHLKSEDFSLDSHRRIYARMMELAESQRPIDLITLCEELDRTKELAAIGDVGYVSSLLDGVPDRPSIEHYVKIVRDKAMLRGLIHAVAEQDGARALNPIMARLKRACLLNEDADAAKARALAELLDCTRDGGDVEVGDTLVRFVPGGPQGRPELHGELFV